MKREERAIFVGVIGLLGTVIFSGLTVYPLQYSLWEGALLAGGFVLFTLIVLDTRF